MRLLVSLTLLFCIAFPALVRACDLEPWSGKERPTAEAVVKEMLSRGKPAFFGKIKVTSASKQGDALVHYRMKVLKQYAGAPQAELEAVSSYKNSCVYVAKEGDERLILLPEGSKKPYELHLYDAHFFSVPDSAIESYLDNLTPTE